MVALYAACSVHIAYLSSGDILFQFKQLSLDLSILSISLTHSQCQFCIGRPQCSHLIQKKGVTDSYNTTRGQHQQICHRRIARVMGKALTVGECIRHLTGKACVCYAHTAKRTAAKFVGNGCTRLIQACSYCTLSSAVNYIVHTENMYHLR